MGCSLHRYDESQGVYFPDKGTPALRNTEWKTMVHVDGTGLHNSTQSLKSYVNHVETLCQASVIANWTVCVHFSKDIQERMRLDGARALLNHRA